MKRIATALVLLLVAGCAGPVTTLYRQGSTFAERRAVADACRINALQRIPPAMITETETVYAGPHFVPCHSRTGPSFCAVDDEDSMRTRITTHDANAALRDRDVVNCLEAAGYSVIERPICRPGTESTGYLKQRDGQIDADKLTCVASDDAVTPSDER